MGDPPGSVTQLIAASSVGGCCVLSVREYTSRERIRSVELADEESDGLDSRPRKERIAVTIKIHVPSKRIDTYKREVSRTGVREEHREGTPDSMFRYLESQNVRLLVDEALKLPVTRVILEI